MARSSSYPITRHFLLCLLGALSLGCVISKPATSANAVRFGELESRYEKAAGPVHILGNYPHTEVFIENHLILEDTASDSVWIEGAFPTWDNPEIVILQFSPGGNACAGSYAVLDIKTAHLTDKFGNCNEAVIRQGTNSLVFAFADKPSEIGWSYENGKLAKLQADREAQHVEIGVSAYKSRNYSLALAHLWLVRESRFPEASYYLGLMANFGRGVKQDYSLAMSLYKQAAEIGSPEAMFRIGLLFANGRGAMKNPSEAVRWYTQAAELGEPLAQYNLALAYLSGVGAVRDPKQALLWMLVAQNRVAEPNINKQLHDKIGLLEGGLDEQTREAVAESASSWKPKAPSTDTGPDAIRVWIGKYPTDRVQGQEFLDRPEIQVLVNGALGSDAVAQMKEMSVVTPIKETDGWLLAGGCQPHMCADGQWSVAINLSNLAVVSCLARVDSSTIRLGTTGKSYIDVPRMHDELCPSDLVTFQKVASLLIGPISSASPEGQSIDTVTVPLQKSGGIYVVPVVINNALTLNFIVDSGAADVSIPADVFLTLVRAGTLQKSDFIGSQTYTLADGSTAPSETFRIRSLTIGKIVVENVTGSVAPVAGPLLLGQSFLRHFKSWSIDNSREALILGRK